MALFTKEEVKRNLLGSLEAALFMTETRNRFGTTADEAIRSFAIPTLLLPLSLFLMYYPETALADKSFNVLTLLYCLRMILTWMVFLGCTYWLLNRVDRREHFCQFVVASNWLSIPAMIVFLPVIGMLLTGAKEWNELYPFMMTLVFYSYAFSAFAATRILRVPWEFACFLGIINMTVNNYATDMLQFVGSIL